MTENPKTARAREATQKFQQQVQENAKQWEAEGRDAWSALKRLGAAKLPKGDEIILARNLGREYEGFKRSLKQRNQTLGDFCEQAGLGGRETSSKELHRLFLKPAADPEKARIRRSAAKYRSLIKAMARVFDQSSAALAGRMLRGTSLHPVRAKALEEVAIVQVMLQEVVDAIDSRFGLYATFMRTAGLKAKFARQGHTCRWPQWDAAWRASFCADQRAAPAADADVGLYEASDATDEQIRNEIQMTLDKRFAYWEDIPTQRHPKPDASLGIWSYGPTPSGCWIDDEFFHVPHVHLGHGDAIGWGFIGNDRKAVIQEIKHSFAEYGPAPEDGWDATNEKPSGQDSSMRDGASRYHAWLLIYPSPDNTRVMPMLMVPWEECGPFLVPLDLNTLDVLEKTSFWLTPEGTEEGFLKRIKRMLGYRKGGKSIILEGLERTAPWLRRNPLIKLEEQMQQEQEEERYDMHRFLNDLWARGDGPIESN